MNTDINNAAFIARHHKMVMDPPETSRRRITPLLVLLFALGYVAIFLVLAFLLGMYDHVIWLGVILFFLAFVGAFISRRLYHLLKLREKERTILKTMIEQSSIGRMITDAENKMVYANDLLCRLIGTTTPSLIDFYACFSQNPEADGLLRAMADTAHRGLSDVIEFPIVDENGEQRVFRVTAKPLEDYPGYLHWLLQDVTSQRLQDRDVAEEREKLIDFTDNAPVGFFSVNEDGRFVFVNATFARWLSEDMNKLQMRGRLHDYLVEPPLSGNPYDVLPGGGARQVGEIKMKGPHGQVILAAVNQSVVHEEDGRVRTRAVVMDLTSQRLIQKALEASEDRFQRFFDEAPLGIALIDRAYRIRDCNHALAHMLGMIASDVEGKNLDIFIDSDRPDDVLNMLKGADQGQPLPPAELRLKGKREPISVQMHARKFKDSDDYVLHFIDLSKQKALEAQFVQSQKMQAIGQLAGGVAHDFNNLLTAMIGFCDLLLLRHKPGDPSFSDINQIKQNANRAANLVRQLLAFSRQQTLRPKVQNITDILIELSHLLRRLLGANIDLQLSHGQDLGLVKVDEGQMEQVLINLAVNARDAMPDGGKLMIETRMIHTDIPIQRGAEMMPAGDWITISVTDTGTGMPSDVMARIFEPFFTTKPVGQGTGLGLSTVYGIMRQTGGYVHVESALFKGTVFTLYLPRAAEAQEVKTEVTEQPKPQDLTGTARILLVEDEDAVRTFSVRALTNKGYQVLATASGEEAVDLFEKQPKDEPIDILITDVVMPNMDGPTVARLIREKNKDLKIIFISGYTEDRLKDYMGPGIFFLPKPFTLKQLAEKVKDVLNVG